MKQFFYISLATFLTACTVNVTPLAMGGSKADGTIITSYEYGIFEDPIVDMEASDQNALKRCKGWGYKSADRFDASQTVCSIMDGDDCIKRRVNITYQCIK